MNTPESIMVTGGARSGKSVFAERLILKNAKHPCYIATAPILDAEMTDRVRRHRERRGTAWKTIEEELDLVGALRKAEYAGSDAVLIDCLTLWVNNLLFHEKVKEEADMAREAEKLAVALKTFPGTVVTVINEVGLGIVPDNAAARIFRDCSGRCGQIVAAAADKVYWLVAGISVQIK